MKFAVGQPVTRIEDTRLITGEGNYTDDINLKICAMVFLLDHLILMQKF